MSRQGAAEESGVALVEFALVAPLLLVLLFGMLDFGRAFNYWIDTTHLANEGARWTVVNSVPSPSGTLQTYLRSRADTDELRNGGSSAVPDPLEVCLTFLNPDGTPGGSRTVGNPVKVTTSVTYNWIPFLSSQALSGLTSTTVSSTSTMRLESVPDATRFPDGCS
jgi:Flp pilus assembly protein TadG